MKNKNYVINRIQIFIKKSNQQKNLGDDYYLFQGIFLNQLNNNNNSTFKINIIHFSKYNFWSKQLDVNSIIERHTLFFTNCSCCFINLSKLDASYHGLPFGSYEIGADFLSSSCLGISRMLAGGFY